MEYFRVLINNFISKIDNSYFNIIISIIIIIIAIIIKSIIKKIIISKIQDVEKKYKHSKMLNRITTLIILFLLFLLWGNSSKSIFTFLGLFSAGLVVALKDFITDMCSNLYINIKKPFDVGDRIEIDGIIGDVVDKSLFKFSLLEIKNWIEADQSTGRIIHIPNTFVLQKSIANYTRGFKYIWDEIKIHLTIDSNLEKAKKLFLEILLSKSESCHEDAANNIEKISNEYLLIYSNLKPIVYFSIETNHLVLSLRYLTEPRKRRCKECEIWEEIYKIIKSNNDIKLIN